MRQLPLIAILLLPASSHATIKSLGFSHQMATSVSGDYRWWQDFGGGTPSGQWHQGLSDAFLLNHLQASVPPQPFSFQQTAPLPAQPLAEWVGTPPSIQYNFGVTEWTATPAGNGELVSLVAKFDASLAVAGPHTQFQFAETKLTFVTTETMAISMSGFQFADPDLGTPLPVQLDPNGHLPPGRYRVARWDTGAANLSLTPAPVDTDGDLLSDADETNIHHTDPTKADTDGDGFTDREEIVIHHTLPLNPDSDEDGFTDGFEYRSGTSPLDPQSKPGAVITIHQAVEIRVATEIGSLYRIQSSLDLQFWTDTNTVLTGTGQEVKIFESITERARYWRAVKVEE